MIHHGIVHAVLAGFVLTCASISGAERWTDISSALLNRVPNNAVKLPWPGACSGVVVNRTNGEVTIKIVGLGLWRSSDQGSNWKRIDGSAISGRDETGWATSLDQNDPGRIASFSLDGLAGWTADGVNWRSFTNLGRNWDFGSVDWAASVPKTILAARHETTPPGEVYATKDGGVSWNKLAIHLDGNRNHVSMVGALDSAIFIYGNGDGIHRSMDAGITWTKVSAENPQTRIPVLFRGAHYLGTSQGLLVSTNLGASWKLQGTPVNIWQGSFLRKQRKDHARRRQRWSIHQSRWRFDLEASGGHQAKGNRLSLHAELVWVLRLGSGQQHCVCFFDGQCRLQTPALSALPPGENNQPLRD